MVTDSPISIFARVMDEHDMTPAEAQRFMSWRFSPADLHRMSELAARNSDGKLSDAERHELEAFIEAGDVLNALHARARKVLRNERPEVA